MKKYFISRILLLFIAVFFIGWAKGSQTEQLFNFFNIDFWFVFKWFVAIIIFLIGIIFLNFSLCLIYWKEYLTCNTITIEVNNKVISKFSSAIRVLVFDWNFSILIFAFNYEKPREKYPVFLSTLVILFIVLMSYQGIPFVNNYSAIHANIGGGDAQSPSILKINNIVVPKNEAKQAEDNLGKQVANDYDIEIVWNDGYMFFQAALIDGFKSNPKSRGLPAYIESIIYYALEKIIRVLLFFLLPYIIGLIVLDKIYKQENELKLQTAIDEINSNNDELIYSIYIINKYRLAKHSNINNIILSFENDDFKKNVIKIINRKNWFDVQSLLFITNRFFGLLYWAEKSLVKITIDTIKNDFDKYNFINKEYNFDIDKYSFLSHLKKPACEQARSYLSKLDNKNDGNLRFDTTLGALLSLIPKNEIEINDRDLRYLNHQNDCFFKKKH